MSNELFNLCSAIGIGLTFFTSIAAIIVSVMSLKYSDKMAKRAEYLKIVTENRDRWSNLLRDSASLYFTQVARLCDEQEEDLAGVYKELTQSHFAVAMLLFETDKIINDSMNMLKQKALEIVVQNNIIVSQLRRSIQEEHQTLIFSKLREILEDQWIKQRKEVKEVLNQKNEYSKQG